VRLLAALLLPPLLVLAMAFVATQIVGGLEASPRTHAQAVVWGKRTFANRAAFARWLRSHGRSYEAWARRHPVKPPVADRPAEQSFDPTIPLGGIAVLAVAGLGFLFWRRRIRRPSLPRPRLGASYARAHSATLVAWHDHPNFVWYVAGGALVAGAALVAAGWS
jgi:hypothetical protein